MGSKYSKEFRRDALRLCEREGVRETSENLGVPLKSLYAWRREERLERGEAPKGLRPGETPEQGFRRLERELAELQEAPTAPICKHHNVLFNSKMFQQINDKLLFL